MPYYFRHTSRFREHQHVRALMRLRCCSDPFAASPTLHRGGSLECSRCRAGCPETAEHALLDCPAYAPLRADARFASLFARPLPAGAARWAAFARGCDQHVLASYVHACFENHSQHSRIG